MPFSFGTGKIAARVPKGVNVVYFPENRLRSSWVIVGGGSGSHARPMNIEWIREIFRVCRAAKVPFFFKQWGGVRKDLTGRLLGGRTYDEMPERVAA